MNGKDTTADTGDGVTNEHVQVESPEQPKEEAKLPSKRFKEDEAPKQPMSEPAEKPNKEEDDNAS